MKWYHARNVLHSLFEGAMLLLIFAAIYGCFYLFGGPVK